VASPCPVGGRFFKRLSHILANHDIVPLENGSRAMPGNLHGHGLRYARADEIAHGTSAQISGTVLRVSIVLRISHSVLIKFLQKYIRRHATE
jgi:hypothetical protein